MLWLFAKALCKHWWALMSSAVFTFLGIYVAAARKGNDWAVRVSFLVALVLILVAAYLAWKDKEQERSAEQERCTAVEDKLKDAAELRQKSRALSDFAEEAAVLRHGIAATQASLEYVAEWPEKVQGWANKIDAFLVNNCAPQASVKFKDFSNMPGVTYIGIPRAAIVSYRALERLIQNLHQILEKPDVYLKQVSQ